MSSSFGRGQAQGETADVPGPSPRVEPSAGPAAPAATVKDAVKDTSPRTITYYAAARNPAGKIGQLLVTRVVSAPGVKVSGKQEWTGITYRNEREAAADLRRLNCVGRS